ncbi:hypothetical protein LIER_23027 [Lithospermum erythrorhizon]|uniref:Uncharacterized protein n=1 Tax=Lithospermum erythrorhizon TaxID=34254 RepID=A0AAV3QZ44_LITER
MAIRKSGVTEAPVYYDANETGILTIKIHHGRAQLRRPNIRYVGGTVGYYDYVDGRTLSVEVLQRFVSERRPLCDKMKIKLRIIWTRVADY